LPGIVIAQQQKTAAADNIGLRRLDSKGATFMPTKSYIVENDRPDTVAKPPPAADDRRIQTSLFQTMDDLRLRHGSRKSRRERILHTTAAVFACLALTSLLYVAILFTH
jgi:hypothetical protein